MTDNTTVQYLSPHNWAILLAYLWTRPRFARDFEADPVQAILAAQADSDPIALDYAFDLDHAQPRTRLLKVPADPGYTLDEYNDAILGRVPVVPVTSWLIHGVPP